MLQVTGNLSAAHRGYFYQDVTTAFAAAEVLAAGAGSVTVDRKMASGDVFDDLTVRGPGAVMRRQLKWSNSGVRQLTREVFTTAGSALRIDRLVRSYIDTRGGGAHEFRLAVAWSAPTDAETLEVLASSAAEPSIPGARSRRFRLKPKRIWPSGAGPAWAPLEPSYGGSGAPPLSRDDFIEFAEHFVIETDTPPFSGELARPGDLEALLLRFLTERVGVGEYPNAGRSPEDVAGRLITLAQGARTRNETLGVDRIAQAVGLRIDYGRVPQQFPVRHDYRVERVALQRDLVDALTKSPVVALVGPPGSGKSWELTELADTLQGSGRLVARHYCYLEPGDPDTERRVTTNVLFGNLIAELIAADPELASAKERTYAASAGELDAILRAAVRKYAPEPVVLVVDGIDHISRVLADSDTLAREDTDIVEELAALTLPAGTRLVIGSQPGPHLRALAGVGTEVTMPPWGPGEVWHLAQRHSLDTELAQAGADDAGVRLLLAERSEGNPLYATFLVRGLLDVVRRGSIEPVEWLRAAPAISGDIANYYAHLYTVAGDVRTVADLLGMIDFSVTEAELRDIVGPLAGRRVPESLDRLRPILVDVAGQGGVRIFHESFRRFVVQRFREEGHPLSDVLDPVAAWLTGLGFFRSSKAYRHLLPVLRRADRIADLLGWVGADFVSESFGWGHPRPAIEANLAAATESAAAEQRWPDLVRCSELWRALYTAFEGPLHDPAAYWLTFLRVFDADAVAERLVYDGRPTLDKHLGLVICSATDDAGGVAPWGEYLDLPPAPFGSEERGGTDLHWVGQVLAAQFHGRVRLRGFRTAATWLTDMVSEHPESMPSAIADPLGDRLDRSLSEDGGTPPEWEAGLPDELLEASLLARSRRLRRADDHAGAAAAAERAAGIAPRLPVVAEALRSGAASLPPGFVVPDAGEIDIGLAGTRNPLEGSALETWVDTVSVLAAVDPDRLEILEREVSRGGWYRSWLQFVIAVSRAEARIRVDPEAASRAAAVAFRLLTVDADPYLGRPRAMDLALLRAVVRRSIERGLAALRTDSDWDVAIGSLDAVASGTGRAGLLSAPILPESVGEMLEPYAERLAVRERVKAAVEARVREAEERGEYFSNHADIELAAARAIAGTGDREAALAHWRSAVVYLAAYGYRKDVTLYQLLEALPAFQADAETSLDYLERLDPLALAVVEHTDGRSTRHLPNACIRALARVDAAAALALVARTQADPDDRFSRPLERAVEDTVHAAAAVCDPRLAVLAQDTIRFSPDHDGGAESGAERRIAAVERLAAVDPVASVSAFRSLAARVEGDGTREYVAAVASVEASAARAGILLGRSPHRVGASDGVAEGADRGHGFATHRRLADAVRVLAPPPGDASPLQLMGWVREAVRPRPDGKIPDDAVVNRIGYACIQLARRGLEEEAVRLVRFVSRELPSFEHMGVAALANLADGFTRYGLPRLAAVSYTLAFARSRGGGGWDSLGGDEHVPWLESALRCDGAEARRTLAGEVALLVQSGYVMGITPGLVRRVAAWGDMAAARAAWEEAYAVIRNRLPSQSLGAGSFRPFRRDEILGWTPDEALAGLIIARVNHPELDRRRAALLSFATALRTRPDAIARPLRHLLSMDGAPTFALLALQVLSEAEPEPYAVSVNLEPVLLGYAGSTLYGERELAAHLLARARLSPAPTTTPDTPILDIRPSADSARRVRSGGRGERIQALQGIWSEIPIRVTRQFEVLAVESEAAKRRAGSLYRYFHDGDMHPQFETPISGWEHELFECALHEVLNGVHAHLWSRGAWNPDVRRELLSRALPQMRLMTAIQASRRVRPNIPLPSATQAGYGEIPEIYKGGDFDGWFRLGRWEREFLYSGNLHHGNPSEVVSIFEGTVVSRRGIPDADDFPLGSLPARAWSLEPVFTRPGGALFGGVPEGPLLGFDIVDDPLGREGVLILPPVFAVRYNLVPGPWPGPLRWVDGHEAPAVAFRAWRVRSTIGIAGEEPSLVAGCDLVVRPEIWERLRADTGGLLRHGARVERMRVSSEGVSR